MVLSELTLGNVERIEATVVTFPPREPAYHCQPCCPGLVRQMPRPKVAAVR